MQRATYPVYVRLQLQHRLMASRSSWPCDKVDSCSNRRTLAVPCSLAGAPWLQFASWSRRRRALQAAKPDVEAETEAVQVALCAMRACVVRCYHWRETILPLNWFCNLFARIMRTCTEKKREGDSKSEGDTRVLSRKRVIATGSFKRKREREGWVRTRAKKQVSLFVGAFSILFTPNNHHQCQFRLH